MTPRKETMMSWMRLSVKSLPVLLYFIVLAALSLMASASGEALWLYWSVLSPSDRGQLMLITVASLGVAVWVGLRLQKELAAFGQLSGFQQGVDKCQ